MIWFKICSFPAYPITQLLLLGKYSTNHVGLLEVERGQITYNLLPPILLQQLRKKIKRNPYVPPFKIESLDKAN